MPGFEGFRAATTTLHVRPKAWKILLLLWALSLFVACFIGLYCDPASDRCNSAKTMWNEDYWGKWSCRNEYCEADCPPEAFLKAPVGALSNVSFVLVGWFILIVGGEDYLYFNGFLAPTLVAPEGQDYTPSSPPNLIVGGAGIFNIFCTLIGSACLHFSGVGSFVFHGGMTDLGLHLDMCSVYTLVTIILPYLFLNHFHCLKTADSKGTGNRVLGLGVVIGMAYAFAWPFKKVMFPVDGMRATTLVPLGASFNFILLTTYFMTGFCYITIRSSSDIKWLFFAVVSMGVAYMFQDDLKFCVSPKSKFQGHAVWHSGMAIGVAFFYIFLRQERRRESDGSWKERGNIEGAEMMVVSGDVDSVV